MTDVLVKPAFVSLLPDSGEATKLGPTAWNAARLFTGGNSGDRIARDPASATGASWVPATDLSTLVPVTRAVNGHALSADVTVTKADVGLGSVENTALSTWAGSNALTTGGSTWTIGGALNLAAVSTDGIVAQNTTAATVGVPVQQSPRIRLRSNVWNTTTPANNTDDWFIESVPVSAATPSGLLKFGKSLNGGAATFPMTLSSVGAITALGNISTNGNIAANGGFFTVGVDTGGFIFGAKTIMGGNATDGLMQITKQSQTVGVGFDVATDGVFKVRTRAQSAYATVDALGYSVGGVAGANKAAGAVTSITVVNGIVTAIS